MFIEEVFADTPRPQKPPQYVKILAKGGTFFPGLRGTG
jgi:hypothetical protein